MRLLRREIIRQKATLLVVDGLLNARSKAETPIDTKKNSSPNCKATPPLPVAP